MKLKSLITKLKEDKIKKEIDMRKKRFWASENGKIVKERSKREQNRTQDGEL